MRSRSWMSCGGLGVTLFVRVVGVSGLALSGCASGPRINTERPYAGPAISVDSSRRVHHLVMEAPTPGWQLTIDRTVEHEGIQRVFATARRPNPINIYAQVIVTQQVATVIPSTQPLEAFVRVLDFDAEDGEYFPLHWQVPAGN